MSTNSNKCKGIFITGTGTDIGKTFVTALIVKCLRESGINAGYYKAALSGAELIDGKLIPGDSKYVCELAGLSCNPCDLVSYTYETAVSPHLAAQIENNLIETDVILSDFNEISKQYDYITVEGSGGIVCPLRLDDKQIMLTDIIKLLNLDVIIVASAELGTINSVVLTVEYAKQHNINVKAIILNNYDGNNFLHVDNKKSIEYLTKIPVVACVANNSENLDIEASTLCKLYEEI